MILSEFTDAQIAVRRYTPVALGHDGARGECSLPVSLPPPPLRCVVGEPRLAHTRALLSRIVVRRLFFLLDAMSKRVRAGRGRASGVADDRIGEPPRERA
jgi:hypothetical protein